MDEPPPPELPDVDELFDLTEPAEPPGGLNFVGASCASCATDTHLPGRPLLAGLHTPSEPPGGRSSPGLGYHRGAIGCPLGPGPSPAAAAIRPQQPPVDADAPPSETEPQQIVRPDPGSHKKRAASDAGLPAPADRPLRARPFPAPFDRDYQPAFPRLPPRGFQLFAGELGTTWAERSAHTICAATSHRQSGIGVAMLDQIVARGDVGLPPSYGSGGADLAASATAARHRSTTVPPEKKHRCPECGKRFVSSSKLERHKRVHTGERPYRCELCPATFTQKGGLKAHTAKHLRLAANGGGSEGAPPIQGDVVNGFSVAALLRGRRPTGRPQSYGAIPRYWLASQAPALTQNQPHGRSAARPPPRILANSSLSG